MNISGRFQSGSFLAFIEFLFRGLANSLICQMPSLDLFRFWKNFFVSAEMETFFLFSSWRVFFFFYSISFLESWLIQVQSIWWVWRDWSCLEPSQALRFPSKPRRSRETLLWNSSSQNIKAQEHHEILYILGWYC